MTKRSDYIEQLIAQGEHEHQDFKYQISDARKIARSISAFANNSGGHLLVGVRDNGNIAGVSSDEEIYMVDQAASMYCQPAQKVQFELFKVHGKTVLKVDIAEAAQKPVKAPDDDGHYKAYYRVADENVLASSLHVKVMKHQSQEADESAVMQFTASEEQLFSYLESHGGITIGGYAKLCHISQLAAEQSVVSLCDMGVISLTYHDGQCLITKL